MIGSPLHGRVAQVSGRSPVISVLLIVVVSVFVPSAEAYRGGRAPRGRGTAVATLFWASKYHQQFRFGCQCEKSYAGDPK